ncbi:MAG: KOW motif-containing protein [Polyangia bacterium]
MFDRLIDADFDAYLPAKQRSNVYNRERLDTKQRLGPLAEALSTALIGTDGAQLEASWSLEHPHLVNRKQVEAQHVYFSRGETARRALDTIIDRARGVASLLEDSTPQRSHVHLAVSLLSDRLEVALRLHPEATVDRQNLLRRCQDPYALAHLVSLVTSLPDGFVGGVVPDVQPARLLDGVALAEQLRRFGTASQQSASLFSFVRSRPRADVLAAGSGVVAMLAGDLAALLPLYRYCAWSRDNDFVSVKEALEKKQTERRQKGIVRGDEVRVVRGLFSGQLGTVQEVDPRGALRLLVGKMTIKLDAADVERRA